MAEPEKLIPRHGGYRKLKSFQIAQLVYDVTVRFCDRYIDKRSRTHDQMVQAARSGVQNIAEGSQASGTSKKTELKLTDVARSSLEELKLDYQDFLRHRNLSEWQREDPRREELIARRCTTADEVAAWAKDVHDGRCGQSGRNGRSGPSGRCGQGGQSGQPKAGKASTPSTKSTASTPSPSSTPTYREIVANGALVLIAGASSLLDRQLAAQEKAFLAEGGFTERLYRMRTQRRTIPDPRPPATGRSNERKNVRG
jgi:four helix bundle suffix protein